LTAAPKTTALEASFSTRLFTATAVAMLLAAVLSIIYTATEFKSQLRPLLAAKVESIVHKVADDVEYALHAGVPFEALRGVDEFLASLDQQHPEVGDLAVLPGPVPDPTGTPASEDAALSLAGRVSSMVAVLSGMAAESAPYFAPIRTADGIVVGHVTARIDETFVLSQMQSLFFDSLVILVAVALVALEVVVVMSAAFIISPLKRLETAIESRANGDLGQYQVSRGSGELGRFIEFLNTANADLRDRLGLVLAKASETLRRELRRLQDAHLLQRAAPGRQGAIIDARIPLFVFSVAEELQKSFLPLFVGEYHQPSDLFDRDIMIGLPISCFMFVIAVITPFAGKLVDRFGSKQLFLLGLVPAIGGYVMCYLATSGNDIVVARSVTAVGYAVIVISSQSYFAAVLTKENRARGMAVFVGVLMAGTMCGTAIGAILAEWLGYKPVFLISIALGLVAGALGYAMLGADVREPAAASGSDTKPAGATALLKNTNFVLVVLFCAIPAKIILTGFLYLLVPIYLATLEASQSEIGRIMMVYSLIIIPISPLASRFADRLGNNLWVVISATILSGIVLIGLYQSESVARVLLVVMALGIAHSFIKAPLIVAAMEAAEQSAGVTRTSALSILRTSERIGSVIGPVIVAAMMVVFSHETTAVLLGVAITLVGIVKAAIVLMQRKTTPAGGLSDA
jgi:predicted MFS family arabinose efflux permease